MNKISIYYTLIAVFCCSFLPPATWEQRKVDVKL